MSNGLKILIVDDDPVVLEIARIVLEGLGHRVCKRKEPLGTTAEIVREQPDVVLVDVYMPVVSGDQLIRTIKEERSPLSSCIREQRKTSSKGWWRNRVPTGLSARPGTRWILPPTLLRCWANSL